LVSLLTSAGVQPVSSSPSALDRFRQCCFPQVLKESRIRI
jgi:hypothetical protein